MVPHHRDYLKLKIMNGGADSSDDDDEAANEPAATTTPSGTPAPATPAPTVEPVTNGTPNPIAA